MTREQFEDRVDQAVPWLTILGAIAAILITVLSGVPDKLPGIALGSTALLYFERWVAAMAATVIGIMLLTRGLKRETPSQASATGVGYPDKVKEAVQESDTALSTLSARVDKLDGALKRQETSSRVLLSVVEKLLGDVKAIKDRLDVSDRS
jgi:hypothetical protein